MLCNIYQVSYNESGQKKRTEPNRPNRTKPTQPNRILSKPNQSICLSHLENDFMLQEILLKYINESIFVECLVWLTGQYFFTSKLFNYCVYKHLKYDNI